MVRDEAGARWCSAAEPPYSLMDRLQELALVFPDLGVVDLLHELGVFVDEPRFPEYVSSRVLHLSRDEQTEPNKTRQNCHCCVLMLFIMFFNSQRPQSETKTRCDHAHSLLTRFCINSSLNQSQCVCVSLTPPTPDPRTYYTHTRVSFQTQML